MTLFRVARDSRSANRAFFVDLACTADDRDIAADFLQFYPEVAAWMTANNVSAGTCDVPWFRSLAVRAKSKKRLEAFVELWGQLLADTLFVFRSRERDAPMVATLKNVDAVPLDIPGRVRLICPHSFEIGFNDWQDQVNRAAAWSRETLLRGPITFCDDRVFFASDRDLVHARLAEIVLSPREKSR